MSEDEFKLSSLEEQKFLYDKLRSEILQNDTLTLQLLGVTLVLFSGAIGFALQSKSYSIRMAVFLGIIILLFISLRQTIERMRSTFIIAGYLRVFLEPQTKHIKWELRLKKFREKNHNDGYNKYNSLIWTYYLIVLVTDGLSCLYCVIAFNTQTSGFISKMDFHSPPLICLIFLLLTLSASVAMYIYNSNEYEKCVHNNAKLFEIEWQEILESEKKQDEEKINETLSLHEKNK